MGGVVLENLSLHMLGRHQVQNAALAVAAVILLKEVFLFLKLAFGKDY